MVVFICALITRGLSFVGYVTLNSTCAAARARCTSTFSNKCFIVSMRFIRTHIYNVVRTQNTDFIISVFMFVLQYRWLTVDKSPLVQVASRRSPIMWAEIVRIAKVRYLSSIVH